MGPVIIDLLGTELNQDEQELLRHPLVGGVILFTRNYQSPEQITALCRAIRQARTQPILITVDQEGGRVQRFRDGFVRLPSMGEIGSVYAESPAKGEKFAFCCGWLMAAEILAVGIDLSFAPVLDLDKHLNQVVGDRGFSDDPTVVVTLATAFMRGMQTAGMAATGKHFPGHGSVTVDSHIGLPIDSRSFTTVYQEDLQPFKQMIQAGINALMPAHIIFSSIDEKPAVFSPYWLKTILREKLNFTGMIFSDDLNMAGAAFAGRYAERAMSALDAGCDMVLICNNRQAAIEILTELPKQYSVANEKFQTLQGKFSMNMQSLHASEEWKDKINFFEHRKLYEKNQ